MRAAAPALAVAAALVLTSRLPLSPFGEGGETGAPSDAPTADFSLQGVRTPGPITLLACGDVLLSRSVADAVERKGYQWPFRNAREFVSSADIAFCNLENPASFIGTPYPGKPANVTFRAPPGTLFGLKWAGFDVVSLANNHMNDYGAAALRETLDYLDLLGIARAGAGADGDSAREPAILRRNGAKVAVLAYVQNSWGVRPAGEGPGVVLAEQDRLAEDIRALRDGERPDYIVVSVHWGEEHQRFPDAFQRDFGRAAIDAGAVLVLGHHPHVLQSLETYRSGLIVYSLGNFVFDMAADHTYDTAALRVTLEGGGIRGVEILPLRIDRYDYAPRPAAPAEADRILAGFRESSRVLGTPVDISEGRGFVRFSVSPDSPRSPRFP